MTRALHVESGATRRPRVVCLHGVTGHGGSFARLAERLAPRPPRPRARPARPRLVAVRAAVEHRRARLAAARGGRRRARGLDRALVRRPARVRDRRPQRPSSSSDSSCSIPRSWSTRHVALFAAENDRARALVRVVRRGDRAAVRREPADERRGSWSRRSSGRAPRPDDDGRWRYRYCQARRRRRLRRDGARAAAVRATSGSRRCSCSASTSYLPYDHLLDAHRAALGELLEVAVVPAGTPCSGTRSRRRRPRSLRSCVS